MQVQVKVGVHPEITLTGEQVRVVAQILGIAPPAELSRPVPPARQVPLLGQLVRHLRIEAGISQRELASRMGAREGFVAELETGRRSCIRPREVDALEAVLEAAPGTLWECLPEGDRQAKWVGLQRGY